MRGLSTHLGCRLGRRGRGRAPVSHHCGRAGLAPSRVRGEPGNRQPPPLGPGTGDPSRPASSRHGRGTGPARDGHPPISSRQPVHRAALAPAVPMCAGVGRGQPVTPETARAPVPQGGLASTANMVSARQPAAPGTSGCPPISHQAGAMGRSSGVPRGHEHPNLPPCRPSACPQVSHRVRSERLPCSCGQQCPAPVSRPPNTTRAFLAVTAAPDAGHPVTGPHPCGQWGPSRVWPKARPAPQQEGSGGSFF